MCIASGNTVTVMQVVAADSLLYLLVCLQDKDGVIWPWDSSRGFRDIGYNPLISGLAPFFIHTGMSLPTQVGPGRGACGGAALV